MDTETRTRGTAGIYLREDRFRQGRHERGGTGDGCSLMFDFFQDIYWHSRPPEADVKVVYGAGPIRLV